MTYTIAVLGGHPYFTFSEKTEVLFTEQTYFTVFDKRNKHKVFSMNVLFAALSFDKQVLLQQPN